MSRLIDINTLAEKLCVKPMTIYSWIHEGLIPHFKLGRLVRFDEELIEDWLKKRKVSGRSQRALDVKL
ncbi:MAG: helix-turn-helix domain-containing protein [Candidatus Edwardsbacteria bacterium]|nr:helix-turn-helix domain-containing protein [Candidatus Edwardsbacteria bacterium]MBU1577771.1 helix-turn-helix domain-containing protein [Candidatus Edwardsbacteria bacterium]MBU2595036.1 helix-turn-helix domain-containing protein [Candidatus Edwardsbacteria bacterium]